MSNLSIREILEIQPALIQVEKFVKSKNEEAKNKVIYWHQVWKEVKNMQYNLIGFGAANKKLSTRQCWDDWHEHLKKLCVYSK